MTTKPAVVVYTDGACSGNPGPGGWGGILISGKHRKEISGGEAMTTNNRMELAAAIAALEALKRPSRVDLHTDSEYVKKGITEWMPKWKANGWKLWRGAKSVKNLDLWLRLDKAAARHRIAWKWVPGHAGDPDNERCDELCSEEIRRQRALKWTR